MAAAAASGRAGLCSGTGACVFQAETLGFGEELTTFCRFSWKEGCVEQGEEEDMGSDNNTK